MRPISWPANIFNTPIIPTFSRILIPASIASVSVITLPRSNSNFSTAPAAAREAHYDSVMHPCFDRYVDATRSLHIRTLVLDPVADE
jgi:hypothetical protein